MVYSKPLGGKSRIVKLVREMKKKIGSFTWAVLYHVSATPTVLYHSYWNYTDVLTVVWRYDYAFYRILKLLFF